MSARIAAALAAALVVSGCAGEPSAEEGAPPTAASAPSGTPAWNPCDGLAVGPIEAALGSQVRIDDGQGEVYRCSVLPETDGEATMSLTYQWGAGTLAEIWRTMDLPPRAKVTAPEVPGADDARLVVNAGSESVAVTGFVQTGDLIQVVNALDLPPYDAAAVAAGTRVVLEQLAAAAPESPAG